MIVCKTKKWGNSIGILIPKDEVKKLELKENQEVAIDIIKKENPLKELFGFGRKNKGTKKELNELRNLLESKII